MGLHFKSTTVYNCLRLNVTIYTVFTVEKFLVTIIIINRVLLDVGLIKIPTYNYNLLELQA
jgi:hypothetical protein